MSEAPELDTEIAEASLPPSTKGDSMRVFRHRDFTIFFSAAAISNGGSWMQLVAVQALLYNLTNSGTWLGLSTVVSLVPALLLTPYAGVLADRVSRQNMLRVTQTVQMCTGFVLWGVYVGHVVSPAWIVGIGFVNGVTAGFQAATWQSFVPLLVPQEDMMAAVRLNSTQYTMARAIGPAFAGIIVQLWGTGACILFDAVSYLLVIVTLLLIRPRANMVAAREQKVWQGLKEGAAYLWNRRPLRLAVILALFVATLGQSVQYVASAISERIFHHSSESNAGLLAAYGIGAVTSSIATIRLGDRLRRSVQMMVGFMMFVVGVGLVPLTHVYFVGQIAFFIAGLGHLAVAVALNTLIQGTVPDEYRGRAMSFYLFGLLAGLPIGSQILGSLGDAIGFHTTLLLDAGALLTLVVVLAVTGLWRDLDATPEQITAVIDQRLVSRSAATVSPTS
ncbi:MAG: putative major facilitator superfamily transporter [Ilumatobacteraceae bacterium]|nr:putative major facilitator superfamily transporter [Ilumatobacteraceae bacterium]